MLQYGMRPIKWNVVLPREDVDIRLPEGVAAAHPMWLYSAPHITSDQHKTETARTTQHKTETART